MSSALYFLRLFSKKTFHQAEKRHILVRSLSLRLRRMELVKSMSSFSCSAGIKSPTNTLFPITFAIIFVQLFQFSDLAKAQTFNLLITLSYGCNFDWSYFLSGFLIMFNSSFNLFFYLLYRSLSLDPNNYYYFTWDDKSKRSRESICRQFIIKYFYYNLRR